MEIKCLFWPPRIQLICRVGVPVCSKHFCETDFVTERTDKKSSQNTSKGASKLNFVLTNGPKSLTYLSKSLQFSSFEPTEIHEVFQMSTTDRVQSIEDGFLIISDKVKCVESVTLTVANKRDSELNPNLCSKTVECKQSILYQLCPKLRPQFVQKSGIHSSETPALFV